MSARPQAGEAIKEAIAIEAEAAEGVEAAHAEQRRGESAVSIDLLLESITKERKSLDLFEQGMDAFRLALEERRRALDQQQELIKELVLSN
jgi:hypothetical protein